MSAVMVSRVALGILSGGTSEAGFQIAEKRARDLGQGSLDNVVDKGQNAIRSAEVNAGVGSTKGLPEAPDFTDESLRKRRTAEALQLMAGRGRSDSFLGAGNGGQSVGRSFLGGR